MRKKNVLVFEHKTLIPLILEARKNKCKILLVKDDGIYMMLQKGQRDKTDRLVNICYAKGFNPQTDENWYDKAHDIMGGDDCVEYLDCHDVVFDALIEHRKDLRVHVTATHLDMFFD